MQGVVFKIAVMVGMTAALQGAQDKLAETGPDIVVIGKRLLGLHIVYSLNGPFLRQCSVDPPTGDLSVDLASCQLVKMCVARGNTIPDNVERCLRRLLADIKAGKTVVRFNTMTKRATVDPAPRPSTEHPVSAAVEKRSAEQDHNSVERDIVVTAPNLPKPGRWMYTTMAASMSPGVPSPPPRSWEQCVARLTDITVLESMLVSASGGGVSGCHVDNLALVGNRISALRVCIDARGRSRGSILGRYDAERIELREEVERFDLGRRSDGGSDRDITMMTTGRRIGEC